MKRKFAAILTVCLLLSAVSVYAAPYPEGFVGVPWGASRSEIAQKMNEMGWMKLTGRNPDEVIYKGAFDGNPCELRFVMAGNSLVEGYAMPIARLPVRNVTATKYTYESIVKHLKEKYGPPTDAGEGPYRAVTTWEFGDGATADKYRIQVMFDKEGTWFSDVDGLHTYIRVDYTAVSLGERLKKSQL